MVRSPCLSVKLRLVQREESDLSLHIEHLSKQYGRKVWGLRDFTLDVESGVIGLLGPNGAGKSTLMMILATITQPTEGRVLWDGGDIADEPNALREVLGYLPQDFGIYPHLSAVEFLDYMAALKGLDARTARERVNELLDLVNLGDVRHRPLGGYSGGMRQRVGIAQALLNDPRLLIVDEPTAGLDPEERLRFRNLLSDLAGERIVILSTHIVPDVEAVATDIALIASGRLVTHALPEQLLQAVEGRVWQVRVPSDALPALKSSALVGSTVHRSDGVHARVVADEPPAADAAPVDPTLEDAYLYFIAGDGGQEGA
jgi:ABC-type multidrug transport system ATPase subunit